MVFVSRPSKRKTKLQIMMITQILINLLYAFSTDRLSLSYYIPLKHLLMKKWSAHKTEHLNGLCWDYNV